MDDKEKIQMFNDDSKAFKLLYQELKDVKNVIVKDVGKAIVGDIKDTDDYLLQLFTKADNKIKTFLHYTNEDLIANGERLRNQIQKVERVGFKNQIVLPYEGMDNKTVEERYAELRRAGVFAEDIKEDKKEVAEIEKKYRIEDKAALNPQPAKEQPTKVTLTSADKTLSVEVDSPKVESTREASKTTTKKKKHWYK